jgi:hypothetical protein
MATIKDFRRWIKRDLSRFSPINTHLHTLSSGSMSDVVATSEVSISLFTQSNEYNIRATERSNGGGYLGCISKSRKPRAGEDWRRGNDLSDGPLSEKTWHSILSDIVSFEMVRIHNLEAKSIDVVYQEE